MFRLVWCSSIRVAHRPLRGCRMFLGTQFNLSNPNDEKLRQIIQSSNLGKSTPDLDQTVKTKTIANDIKETNDNKEENSSKDDFNKQDAEMFSVKLKQDIKERVEKLPSQREELRNTINKKVDTYMDSLQQTIFKATSALNDVTGYSAIEQLKLTIDSLEQELKDAKQTVKGAKDKYTKAIQERSLLQKEINELLTRKHNWSQNDLERFTELYRNDHVNEQGEISAQEQLTKAEQLVDSIQLKLTQLILTRYHEEQIWSDKIRRASTWGTWFLMGFNIMLFVVATFIVEPWKRRKMVGSFEDKVKQAILDFSDEQRGKMDKIITNQTRQDSKDISGPVYRVEFPMLSWAGMKRSIKGTYQALVSPEITGLQFDKAEFGVLVSLVSLVTGITFSMITYTFIK